MLKYKIYFKLFSITVCYFFCIFSILLSQDNRLYSLKQVVTYHSNSKIKTIRNIILDSCYSFNSELGDTILTNNCYYGFFKEYYSSGILKTLGQYDCITEHYNKKGTNYSKRTCFEVGNWYDFDSLGKAIKLTKYEQGCPTFYKYPFKQDTIKVYEDSVVLELKDYKDITSYIIKRSRKNKYLLLKAEKYSNHNYWLLVDKPYILLNSDTMSNFYGQSSFYLFFKKDDIPSKYKENIDISELKAGHYYIYYGMHRIGNYEYEIEIKLEDIP